MDNYKDISVHTSGWYRLFIISACLSVALNSRARYSRMDSDWASVFVSFINWKKNRSESDSNDIVSLCLYRYSCGLCYSLILRTSFRTVSLWVCMGFQRIYFCLYSVCTSHWCLVMSFWLKVCIYSHTRGVKLGLGLGFMQTSQVLPHWLNQSFLFEPCLIHRGIVMLE